MEEKSDLAGRGFIHDRIRQDLASGNCQGVVTRFPPEPNGYLHIGHAKAAFLNANIAKTFSGRFLLRFDDTNPEKESAEFAKAIIKDLLWLGCEWEGEPRYTSDYFEQLYGYAVELVQLGHAYVCDLSADEIAAQRGSLTETGVESPYRQRTMEENFRFFEQMRLGERPQSVLRAKIDMTSGNINMRDPVLYRHLYATHYRCKNQWRIYPTYDFAHCLSDAIEGVTHSLCTLEFADHKPLYDWVLEKLGIENPPKQIEFARLNLTDAVTSKRTLRSLIDNGQVGGWTDPRLVTIRGLRRRGYPADALRTFCSDIGVSRADSTIEFAQLEHALREKLGHGADRAMCVLNPLKVALTNFEELGQKEVELLLPAHPDRKESVRRILCGSEIYIEHDDYSDAPPPKYKRLTRNQAVRLRGGWVIFCEDVEYEDGKPACLFCRLDKDTLGVKPNYKIGGVIHWVPATATNIEVRLYEKLFIGQSEFNPDSLRVVRNALLEPGLDDMAVGEVRQFERLGYFCKDSDSTRKMAVFNRTVSLRSDKGK